MRRALVHELALIAELSYAPYFLIRKLLRKIGDNARNPRYILSERGLGYRMPVPKDA